QFVGVPDEPLLDPGVVGLQVELEAQDVRPQRERLVGEAGCGGQPVGPGGRLEPVAVPVQHGGAVQVLERGRLPFRRQVQRRVADVLAAGGDDAGPGGAGDQLGAQADAQGGGSRGDPPGDECGLLAEEAVGAGLVDPDGAAEDDEQVGAEQLRLVQRVDAGIAVGDPVAAPLQPRAEDPQVLDVEEAQGEGGGYRMCSPVVGGGAVLVAEAGA